jgi:spore maturation protein CgeB
VKHFQFNRERDRYIYARAKVGLKVHLPEQIDWACELNERTYQLAACGVPQLIDHPMLLNTIFGSNSFFIAETPAQYDELFDELMRNPSLGLEKALYAQREVFASHTTFHRAKSLIDQLRLLK